MPSSTCAPVEGLSPSRVSQASFHALLVHLGCCHGIPQTGWLLNNRNLFLRVLPAGKSKVKCWQSMSAESLFPGAQMAPFLCVPTWGRARQLPIHKDSVPVLSSPEFPDATTAGLGSNARIWGVDLHAFYAHFILLSRWAPERAHSVAHAILSHLR